MGSFARTTAAMAPPHTSRPSAGIKRDSSYLSSPSDHDSLLSSQSKRHKVAFDDKVSVRVMAEWDGKPMDLVREEVRAGIEGHLRPAETRDDTGYESIRTMFADATWDPATYVPKLGEEEKHHTSDSLKKYMIALIERINELKKGCSSMILAVLDMNWVGRSEVFVSLYVRFLGALASASPGFLRAIMERIVRHFAILPAYMGAIPGEAIVTKSVMMARFHNTLQYLLRLVPSSSASLAECLRNEFPNHRIATRRQYVDYVKNMLRMPTYAPEIKGDVLTLTSERLLKLDVEIQEEIDDLEDDTEESALMAAGASGLTLDDDEEDEEEDDDKSANSDDHSVNSDDLEESPEEKQLKYLRESVAKLDAVLDLLFEHYFLAYTEGNIMDKDDIFEQLSSQFMTFVLPTYRSRHSQFLMFLIAQGTQAHCSRFISDLLTIIMGRSQNSVAAISSAAYLASFIARGSRVPRIAVREAVRLLSQHLTSIRRANEQVCRGPDLDRYTAFYACSQALLYIFCFRWRDLIVVTEDLQDVNLDDFDVFTHGEPTWTTGTKELYTQVIYSRFNPLKVCSPIIVSQFAAIANHLRFLYVYPLLETNKRLRLSTFKNSLNTMSGGVAFRESALTLKAGEAHCQLDAYFPFDPYLLPNSKKWLKGYYTEWKSISGMQAPADDSDDDDASDASDDDDELLEDDDDLEVDSESS